MDFQVNDFVIPNKITDVLSLDQTNYLRSFLNYDFKLDNEVPNDNFRPKRVASIYRPNGLINPSHLILDNGRNVRPLVLAIKDAKLIYRPELLPGDRVRITKKPNAYESSRHFIKEGALATVYSVEYNGVYRYYGYNLLFDDESWINRDGEIVPIEENRKHIFCLHHSHIEKAPKESEIVC